MNRLNNIPEASNRREPPGYLAETRSWLRERGLEGPFRAGVILGSGLGDFAGRLEESTSVPYREIPHFPATSVAGHAGELVAGLISGHRVVAFGGRFHHYEGFSFEQAALPVYLASALPCRKLIISSAAGAVNTGYRVGDLMVVGDLIRQNMRITPPAPRHRYGQYPHAETAYRLARELGLPVHLGTYLYVKGPNYETAAEIRAFRRMGADAVGMSTAPELFEASRLGLPAVAVSLISNMATGVTGQKLSHGEVKQAAGQRREEFARLVRRLIEADWGGRPVIRNG